MKLCPWICEQLLEFLICDLIINGRENNRGLYSDFDKGNIFIRNEESPPNTPDVRGSKSCVVLVKRVIRIRYGGSYDLVDI